MGAFLFSSALLPDIIFGRENIFLFFNTLCQVLSRDSSVGIATGYGLDDQGSGSSSPGRVKNFLFSGVHPPPIKWIPGVKRQGREAGHSPPTSAEVKKMWIYTSTPPYIFMA
jgi:hypothetical protein